jgi:hypothetical protein
MRKYVLPTLVSLALSSSYALAQDQTQPSSPQVPDAISNPSPDAMAKHHQEMMAKRLAEMQEMVETQRAQMEKQRAQMEKQRAQMQALTEKLHQTNDPGERQRLMDEMRQQQQQDMKSYDGRQGYGWNTPPWNSGPGYYGPKPRSGYYNAPYDRADRMPKSTAPKYRDRPGKSGKKRGGHHDQVEISLNNIEKLLQQVVDLLSKQK